MSFDSLARWYAPLEYAAFGRELERCRFEFHDDAGRAARALLLGDGDGRYLRWLLAVNPTVRVDSVDASAVMLARSRARLDESSAARVHFVQADARAWTYPPAAYDLIVTQFFLDCFPEPVLTPLLSRIAASAASPGSWIIADFEEPPGRIRGRRAKVWLGLLYAFFRRVAGVEAARIVDPSPALRQFGFERVRRIERQWGLLKSELWMRERKAAPAGRITG